MNSAELEMRQRRHIDSLAYVRHPVEAPDGLMRARDYIASELRDLGFAVRLQLVTSQPVEQYNVLARMPDDHAARAVIIEAHYDTVAGSPGADDNASGVAGVLEIARSVGPRPGVEFASFCSKNTGSRVPLPMLTHSAGTSGPSSSISK